MPTKREKSDSFTGEYDLKLDERNRVAVPNDWRLDDSDDALYFAWPYPEGYIQVLPREKFEELKRMQQRVPIHDKRGQRAFAIIFKNGEILTRTTQGRILLSKKILARVGIEPRSTVRFIGSNDLFQIWNIEAAEAYFDEDIDLLETMAAYADPTPITSPAPTPSNPPYQPPPDFPPNYRAN